MGMDKLEVDSLLKFCESSIGKNREIWKNRTTGPYWSDLIRYVKLYDLVRELLAEQQIIIDSAAEEIAAQKEKNYELLSALKSMVRQYCFTGETDDSDNPYYSHDFMSAGEEAIDLLLRLGVVQHDKLENFLFVEDLR